MSSFFHSWPSPHRSPGSLIDATRDYPLVFSIGITLAVVAVLGFGLLVREPRTGRVYAFKQIDAR